MFTIGAAMNITFLMTGAIQYAARASQSPCRFTENRTLPRGKRFAEFAIILMNIVDEPI